MCACRAPRGFSVHLNHLWVCVKSRYVLSKDGFHCGCREKRYFEKDLGMSTWKFNAALFLRTVREYPPRTCASHFDITMHSRRERFCILISVADHKSKCSPKQLENRKSTGVQIDSLPDSIISPEWSISLGKYVNSRALGALLILITITSVDKFSLWFDYSIK